MLTLFSVSLPRAGHHVAEMVLGRLLGARFAYCEFYTIEGCCRAIPCRRIPQHGAAGALLFMQKSHDHELADPLDPGFDGVLVQVREPVARALSNYELDLRTVGPPHSPEYLRYWLGLEAAYTLGFLEKWCARPDARTHVLKYEDLLSDPVTYYRRLFERFGLPMQAFDAEAVLAAQQLSSGDRKPFRERDIRRSLHYEPFALGEFQRLVAQGAATVGYAPHADLVSAGGSPAVALAFQARRKMLQRQPSEALAALDSYLALPDAHPFARLARARLMLARGEAGAAARDCDAVIAAFPAHPRAYVDQALARHARGDLRGARAGLDACLERATDLQRAVELILRSFNEPALTEGARALKAKPAVSREDVIAAFRFILGREPEDDSVIEAHRRVGSAAELREILLRSAEFTDKYRRLLEAPGHPRARG